VVVTDPRKRRASRLVGSQWVALAFAAPLIAYLLVFYAFPLIRSIDLSVHDYTIRAFVQGSAEFVGFANYAEVLSSPLFMTALWNTGIFVWSARVVLDSFQRNAPDVFAGLEKIAAELRAGRKLPKVLEKIFPTIPKIAVDYAVLEKADNVVVLPAGFDWDDVGSWTALTRHFKADAAGNIARGDVELDAARDNVVISQPGHLVGVYGTDGLIVVHTDDATLVVPKSRAGDIKKLLAQIAARKDGKKWL